MTRHGKAPAAESTGEGSSSTRGPDSDTVGTTRQSGESQEEENTFAGETVRQIETLVESFRTGKSTKSQTIVKIGQVLAKEQIGDEQSKLDSLERYASTLDSIETHSAQTAKHGERLVDPVLGKRKEVTTDGDKRYESFDGDTARTTNHVDLDNFVERLSKDGISQHADDDSGGESSNGEFENDESDK